MKVEQLYWNSSEGWEVIDGKDIEEKAQLVFAFGDTDSWKNLDRLHELRNRFPQANLVCATGSGTIMDVEFHEEGISAIALYFEKSTFRVANQKISNTAESFELGASLSSSFPQENLSGFLVVASPELLDITEFVKGVDKGSPATTIAGVFAGAPVLEAGKVGRNQLPHSAGVTMIAFYGENISVRVQHDAHRKSQKEDWHPVEIQGEVESLSSVPALSKINQFYTAANVQNWEGSAPVLVKSGKVPVFVKKVNHETLSLRLSARLSLAKDALDPLVATEEELIEQTYKATEGIKEETSEGNGSVTLVFSNRFRKAFLSHPEEELEMLRELCGDDTVMVGFYSFAEFYRSRSSEKVELQFPSILTFTLTEK